VVFILKRLWKCAQEMGVVIILMTENTIRLSWAGNRDNKVLQHVSYPQTPKNCPTQHAKSALQRTTDECLTERKQLVRLPIPWNQGCSSFIFIFPNLQPWTWHITSIYYRLNIQSVKQNSRKSWLSDMGELRQWCSTSVISQILGK
jgi:hypothetical protein